MMTGTEMLSLNDFIEVWFIRFLRGSCAGGKLLPWIESLINRYERHITSECVVGEQRVAEG